MYMYMMHLIGIVFSSSTNLYTLIPNFPGFDGMYWRNETRPWNSMSILSTQRYGQGVGLYSSFKLSLNKSMICRTGASLSLVSRRGDRRRQLRLCSQNRRCCRKPQAETFRANGWCVYYRPVSIKALHGYLVMLELLCVKTNKGKITTKHEWYNFCPIYCSIA